MARAPSWRRRARPRCLGGAALAVTLAGIALVRRGPREPAFRALRQNLGRAILLGLEFLVAADIIRTVSTVPTLRQVAVLGAIVAIRTFLSFTLEVELEGRWPWQRRRGKGAPPRERPVTRSHALVSEDAHH